MTPKLLRELARVCRADANHVHESLEWDDYGGAWSSHDINPSPVERRRLSLLEQRLRGEASRIEAELDAAEPVTAVDRKPVTR